MPGNTCGKQQPQTVNGAVVQWMMATYFKLTLLGHVHFPPHKPSIVATFTQNSFGVKCEDNGKGFYGEPRTQHCKTDYWSKH